MQILQQAKIIVHRTLFGFCEQGLEAHGSKVERVSRSQQRHQPVFVGRIVENLLLGLAFRIGELATNSGVTHCDGDRMFQRDTASCSVSSAEKWDLLPVMATRPPIKAA